MPQIKSQMKRVKTNNKAHKLIVSKKSALKSSIAYNSCCSKLDKAVAKGIYHKNYASRQKSRLATAVNSIK